MGKLQGKIALVTGGSSGIGFATARLFLAEGARVAITGHYRDRLDTARAALGGECIAIHADARDTASIEPVLARIDQAFGAPDILFLNAGIAPYASLADSTEADFDEMFALHVKTPFFTVQKAAPRMRDGGSIVITTSITNRIGVPDTHMYAATKAASAQLVRTLAAELAPRRIRVNAVCPGGVVTDIGRTMGLNEDVMDAFLRQVLAKIPLARLGEASELASAVLFLASDDSSYITGTELVVDGGWTEVN